MKTDSDAPIIPAFYLLDWNRAAGLASADAGTLSQQHCKEALAQRLNLAARLGETEIHHASDASSSRKLRNSAVP